MNVCVIDDLSSDTVLEMTGKHTEVYTSVDTLVRVFDAALKLSIVKYRLSSLIITTLLLPPAGRTFNPFVIYLLVKLTK